MKFSEITVVGLKFVDISSEDERIYNFGEVSLTIRHPIALHVSKSGGHRIIDSEGFSHYIPPRWFHICWKGNPQFVL